MVSPRRLRGWNWNRVHWAGKSAAMRLKRSVGCQLRILKIWTLSLCYNEFVDKYYVADTAMEPMFWFVDHFTKFFGPMFVIAVCTLVLSVVVVVYIIGVPFWWQKSVPAFCVLFAIGHWLLVNIVFHYWMAFITPPGYLPEDTLIPEAVSICKKCISPKPPRTHHCSICNKCILKMDHHCPWLNNCIGHYNHRYFFMFMAYMVAGILFVMAFGFEVMWEHFFEDKVPDAKGIIGAMNTMHDSVTPKNATETSGDAGIFPAWLVEYYDGNRPMIERMKEQYWYHVCIVYLSLLCSGVLVALGALTAWHARLIGRGETSIEAHINKSETKRLKKTNKMYINPYNFGSKENWNIFLGLQNGRNWRHVLLPSTHKPEGNGLQWKTAC